MSDGKLKSNIDELWAFFSDLNFSLNHLDEECEECEKKLYSIEQRLQAKLREIGEKITTLYNEIQALRTKKKDKSEDVEGRIAALQAEIYVLEEKKVKIKKYISMIPDQLRMLKSSQKRYQEAIGKGKKIVNKYLKMVEISIAQKEFSDYQKTTKNGKYHTMQYRGTTFYCNDDAFDIGAVDSKNRTNLQRMESGLAPLDKEGKTIELHHMIQSEKNGGIVEISGSMHRENHKALHINTHDIPSGIDRANFDVLRSAYWKRRAEFIKYGDV